MDIIFLEKMRNFIFNLLNEKYECCSTEEAVEIFEQIMQSENKDDILFKNSKNFFSKFLKNKTKELDNKKEAIILIELISKRMNKDFYDDYDPFHAIEEAKKIVKQRREKRNINA